MRAQLAPEPECARAGSVSLSSGDLAGLKDLRPIVEENLAGLRIQGDVSDAQPTRQKIAGAPQQCVQTRDQLLEIEGFHQIIIGAVA